MNQEPSSDTFVEIEVESEPSRASSPDALERTPLAGDVMGDAQARQSFPSSTSSHPPAPSRFNTAAPLAPPRPSSSGTPPRPSNVPPAPRIPASQAAEKLVELQAELDLTKRTLATRDAEIRALLVQRDARIAELESVKSQLAAREFSVKELEFSIIARETKIRDLEAELDTLQRPGEGPGDDLQQIRGIGRGFERELRRIGIRTFEQIAAWTTDDIETIAPQIKAQAERIRRDRWVEHAAELAAARVR
jgi:predicted flap endonuclease-1-like 5' DNA nuclease